MDSFEKKYYKIREVAEIIGLPASTLRFWEKQFSIIKPHRNEHGTRFYTASDIESIRMIHYLVKDKGYKLDAAQEEIRRNRNGVSRQHLAVERLKSIREQLVALQQALSRRPGS
ncbi:MAG: MerR family transcriptional regulator [Muribaculaceae bacterium]|nr:MerR family transcriptional regulator [Muribaculaceae bacterium]